MEECIDAHGAVAFQNASGVSTGGFLELLSVYLKSTYVTWEGNVYLQKRGVCIGSCIAPALSDLFLAQKDRLLQNALTRTNVRGVFRYVDDYLVLCDGSGTNSDDAVSEALTCFSHALQPLAVTHEVPTQGSLRFLDLRLELSKGKVCWAYEPRGDKAPLPFESAHSKLVKRAIANLCLTNALKKSCIHAMEQSFRRQVDRLTRLVTRRTFLCPLRKNEQEPKTQACPWRAR